MRKRTVSGAICGAALLFTACGSDPSAGDQTGMLGTNNPVVPPVSQMVQPVTAGSAAIVPVQQMPMAGSAAMPPVQQMMAGSAAMPPVEEMPPEMPAPEGVVLAMDECNLDTGFPGDEFCIKPPPEDMGFQMHVGPSNYQNPEPQYVLQPNEELTENFSAVSGNATDVYYYWRQYRMRPGSHHLIITSGGGFGGGGSLGGSSSGAKDSPPGGIIAPENKGVGMMLAAHSPLNNSFHTFNFTEAPSLKEAWVNFWYRDPSEVTEASNEVFTILGMGIAPGEHVLKHGSCDVTGSGRLLDVYGHVHAHNKRFSVWRTRGSDTMLIHEAFDWEHPGISEFSSTVKNAVPDLAAHSDGGYSGIVDLKPGDKIEFECDIVNDTQTTFLGANEAENDEMCIMRGDSVGTSVSPICTGTDLPGGN